MEPSEKLELKVGGVVLINKHGHTVTISEIIDAGVKCNWFIGAEPYKGTFNEDELTFIRH